MRSLLTLALVGVTAVSAQATPQWRFDLKANTSGIVALESIVVSPTLVIWFDRASDDPLQINGHSAWGAIWNLETSTVTPLDVFTNSFCASGALISNGSMVSIGGDPALFPGNPGIHNNGNTGIRIFEPCASPSGEGCTLFEDPDTLHLAKRRWYPSAIRIFDGGLFIAGGSHESTPFYNTDPENTFEFFPPRAGGARPSKFLESALPSNLFPRSFALPDGRIFLVAGNKTAIYDTERDVETVLPDIPNGVQVTNPGDGSAILLPLSPPNYVPEVLVCGGIAFDTRTPSEQLNSQDPATTQCSRMVVTPQGIARGWQVEHMLEPRVMPELVHIPNGQVLITNGGRTGYAAVASVGDPAGNSNADHPVLTPALYSPDLPLGSRISNIGMPTSPVARMYHSSVTLTPQGNFLIAGSNPNVQTVVGPNVTFPSEFRVTTLDPPFMFVDRPVIRSFPAKLQFGRTFTVPITIPRNLAGRKIQVSLMDLGFSSHAFHSGARLVFMNAVVSPTRRSLTFTTPPNGRVYPPGPAFVFLTVDNVTSEGTMVMMGSGRAPPTLE